MAEAADTLLIDGHEFNTDDLTYEEMREVKRVIRNELWDEDLDGPFAWDRTSEFEWVPATILIVKRREDPDFTLTQALGYKPAVVLPEAPDPPTPPDQRSRKRSAPAKAASANSGSPS